VVRISCYNLQVYRPSVSGRDSEKYVNKDVHNDGVTLMFTTPITNSSMRTQD